MILDIVALTVAFLAGVVTHKWVWPYVVKAYRWVKSFFVSEAPVA